MITRKLYYSAILLIGLLAFQGNLFARGELLSKKYNWSYDVNNGATVRLENYDCDVNIISSNSGKVQFELVVDAESSNQDDLDILNDYLQNLKFQSRADLVSLETIFWNSRNTNKLRGKNSTKIKLKNGETVSLSEFKIFANLHIPVSSKLELDSKYSKINIGDVQVLELDSYDDNIFGGVVNGKVKISAKYTDFEFDEFGPSEFDFYDCNFTAKKTGDLEIETKYSDIKIDLVGELNVESYDDNFTFQTTGNFKMNTKYSDIKSETSGNVTLHIYDSNFNIEKIGHLEISESKYSEYKMEEVGIVDVMVSYDDNFLIGNAISVKINASKYSDFIHDNVDSFFELIESYDDNVKIYNTSPAFKKLGLNGKYSDIILKTASGLPLKIDWKTKHGKIELDDDEFTTRIKIKENSEYEYQGFRGKESDDMPIVKVRGYDNKMDLK